MWAPITISKTHEVGSFDLVHSTEACVGPLAPLKVPQACLITRKPYMYSYLNGLFGLCCSVLRRPIDGSQVDPGSPSHISTLEYHRDRRWALAPCSVRKAKKKAKLYKISTVKVTACQCGSTLKGTPSVPSLFPL